MYGWLSLLVLLTPTPAARSSPSFEAQLRTRAAGIPSGMLDAFYSVHGDLWGPSAGVAASWADENFRCTAAFDTIVVMMEPQVWLEVDEPPNKAEWVEEDLTVLSATVAFAYDIPVYRGLSLMPSLGWGPLFLRGSVMSWPTVGEEGTPVEERRKNPNAKGEPIWLPRRFLASDLSLHLRYRFHRHLLLQADAGWHTILYGGLAIGVWY